MGGRDPEAVVRASPHYYNTDDELEALVELVGTVRFGADPAHFHGVGVGVGGSAPPGGERLGRLGREATGLLLLRAGHEVVVDHSDRLQEAVDDGGADETESPSLEVGAQPVGQLGAGGQLLEAAGPVDHGPVVDPPQR